MHRSVALDDPAGVASKVTAPVGVPPPEVGRTVAVKVAGCPEVGDAGNTSLLVNMVVVGAWIAPGTAGTTAFEEELGPPELTMLVAVTVNV